MWTSLARKVPLYIGMLEASLSCWWFIGDRARIRPPGHVRAAENARKCQRKCTKVHQDSGGGDTHCYSSRRSVAGGSSARAPGNQNNESTRLRLSHLIKYAKIYPWQGSVLKRRSSFAAKERAADFDSVGAAPQAAAKSGVNCFRYLKPDDFKETESVPAKFLYKQNSVCFNSVLKTHFRQSQLASLKI